MGDLSEEDRALLLSPAPKELDKKLELLQLFLTRVAAGMKAFAGDTPASWPRIPEVMLLILWLLK